MRIRILLYSDEWATLARDVSRFSPAHHCLNPARNLSVPSGEPDIELFCDEHHARKLLEEANQYCPTAVSRIAAALESAMH